MANETFLEPGVVAQFGTNLKLVGQQLQAKIVPYVDADLSYAAKGDRYTDETFGRIDLNPMEAQWANSPESTLDQYRRVSFFKPYNAGVYTTSREQAEKLIDPMNAITRAMAAAIQRRHDKSIIEDVLFKASMFETTPDGDITTKAFPAGNIVDVDEDSYFRGRADGKAKPTGGSFKYMTPAKARKALEILDTNQEMQMSQPVCLIEKRDLLNLLTSEELTDADLTQIRRLETGELTSWMGIDWQIVHPGTLPNKPGSATIFYAPVYLREYAIFKSRPMETIRVTERADKNFQPYVYTEMHQSGLRSRDEAFVWVEFQRTI